MDGWAYNNGGTMCVMVVYKCVMVVHMCVMVVHMCVMVHWTVYYCTVKLLLMTSPRSDWRDQINIVHLEPPRSNHLLSQTSNQLLGPILLKITTFDPLQAAKEHTYWKFERLRSRKIYTLATLTIINFVWNKRFSLNARWKFDASI